MIIWRMSMQNKATISIKLIILTSIFFLIGCSEVRKNEVSSKKYYGFQNWEKVTSTFIFDFTDYYYLKGPVKSVEVYFDLKPTDAPSYNLYLSQKYSPDNKKVEEYWFPANSDNHYTIFIYDELQRLTTVEQYNDLKQLMKDISKKYIYLQANDGISSIRELYQNDKLIQTEMESGLVGGYKLVIDNKLYGKSTYQIEIMDDLLKRYTETKPLGSKYITRVFNLEYNSEGEIEKIMEYSSILNKNIFVTTVDEKKNNLPYLITVNDFRGESSSILYRYKISQYDKYNNWLMLDTYDDKGNLLQRAKRQIIYYE